MNQGAALNTTAPKECCAYRCFRQEVVAPECGCRKHPYHAHDEADLNEESSRHKLRTFLHPALTPLLRHVVGQTGNQEGE